VGGRLLNALVSSVAPRPICNPIAAPNLTEAAGDEAWAQPLSLALHAARGLRQSISDPCFQRQVKPLALTQDEFESAEGSLLEKCHKVVALIRGGQDQRA